MASVETHENILVRYPETKYVSRNKTLQMIAQPFHIITSLLTNIQQNNWREVDDFFYTNPGSEHFILFYQQLFHYFNILKEITYKQYQIAFGIQQIRWMDDDENRDRHRRNELTLVLWEELDNKTEIFEQFNKHVSKKLRSGKTLTEDFFNGTIWYRSRSTNPYDIFNFKHNLITIPETFNFSSIACIYRPSLTFGKLSSTTLTKHIIQYRVRPYTAHYPTSNNLKEVHGHRVNIATNWYHDFLHASASNCTRAEKILQPRYTCRNYSDFDATTLLEDDDFTDCLNKPYKRETVATDLNDNGFMWFDVPIGGKKTKRKTSKKKFTIL